MKVLVMCENCNRVVELVPETIGNICYVQEKLSEGDMLFDYDAEAQVTDSIEEINEYNDVDDISLEVKVNSIKFTCKHCGDYIEFESF